MSTWLAFMTGFATGWITRGAVKSTHSAVVGAATLVMQTMDRVRRVVASEREHMEDLIAEARARRDDAEHEGRASPSPVEPGQEQAA